jgi:glyoxylase-like metal-dependent hydrolase (beta-lactamase superfamily II)
MENVMQENPHACWDPAYLDEEAYHWLFEQNRRNRYEVNFIKPGIWHLEDYFAASFYLVEGKDKALAIDTGMGKADIMPLLKSITSLPIALAITHAHGDHMYHADEFAEAYINEKENKVLPRFKSMMMADRNFDNIKYIYVDDGDIIDLGGQIEIEVAEIGGHTPGSIAFIDRAHNVVFSGDALGSGVGAWMQVPFGLPLTEYRDNIRHFAAKIADIEPLVFYGGHAMFGERTYNPLCKQLVSDMAELCDKLLDGEIVGTVSPMKGFDGETVYSAAYGMGSMLYIQKQLK